MKLRKQKKQIPADVSRFHTRTEQHLTHKKQERRNKYEKRDTV